MKLKHIVVEEPTHKKLKKLAAMSEMTMMEYVAWLIKDK